MDINQCPTPQPQEGDEQQIEKGSKINIFGGTDKCKPETTKVSIYLEHGKCKNDGVIIFELFVKMLKENNTKVYFII